MAVRKLGLKNVTVVSAALVLLLVGCDGSKHQRGDCLLTDDGFIWFVADVDGDSYVVRGRFGDEWGSAVKMKQSHGDRYELVPSCVKPNDS